LLRKTLLSVVMFSSFSSIALLSAPAFATEIGDPILQRGSTGPLVEQLQQQLKDLGYFPSTEDTTEYFGSITTKAVLDFKKDHGLTGEEKVGKTTEAEILKELAKHKETDSNQSTTRTKIVKIAKQLNGTPYAWGGTSPNGFDCSGFTKYVYGQVGISLPRTSEDQYKNGQAVAKNSLQPGDLVFFNSYGSGASHVGIYIGDGQFIHAASEQVQIDKLNDPYYWSDRFIGARSVVTSNE
jgi:peptidoglycan DL-endopeptidase CwlO